MFDFLSATTREIMFECIMRSKCLNQGCHFFFFFFFLSFVFVIQGLLTMYGWSNSCMFAF